MEEKKESIRQIEQYFVQANGSEELQMLYRKYEDDERASVRNLVLKYQKKELALAAELHRLETMLTYERANGFDDDRILVCGVDEAGRGPLAGPVVAGCAVLPRDCGSKFLYVNDSKQLSEKKREELYDVIMEHALYTGVGIVPAGVIDEINILQATYEAMRQAIGKLGVIPNVSLNDAVIIPNLDESLGIPKGSVRQVKIIKGDANSLSIAAGSILAKVTRDRMMREYDKLYPEYGFAGHKGYGCASHIEAIRKYGPCPLHRETFIKNFL